MKKMIYIILGIVLVILVGLFLYNKSDQKIVNQCKKKAEIVKIKSTIPNASSKVFYDCLVENNLNPSKYKWEGKTIDEYVSQTDFEKNVNIIISKK